MISKIFNILFGIIFIVVGAAIIKNGGGSIKGFPVTPVTGFLLCSIGVVEVIYIMAKKRKGKR